MAHLGKEVPLLAAVGVPEVKAAGEIVAACDVLAVRTEDEAHDRNVRQAEEVDPVVVALEGEQ